MNTMHKYPKGYLNEEGFIKDYLDLKRRIEWDEDIPWVDKRAHNRRKKDLVRFAEWLVLNEIEVPA